MENGEKTPMTGSNPGGTQAPAKAACTTIDIPLRHSFTQSCWKRRTMLEKMLLFILVATILIFIIVAIVLSTTLSRRDNVCLTEECIRISARVLDAMDSNVDPCEDFFEHACGSWNRMNPIPEDRSSYNTFRKLQDELQGLLRVILEKPIAADEMRASKNVKYLYQSCMNTSLIEKRNEEPLMDLLRQLGGWPVVDKSWKEENFVLEEQLGNLRLLHIRPLIHQFISADDKNSNVHIITIDQPQLGIPSRDYYLKTDDNRALNAYRNLTVNVAVSLGADPAVAEREMENMINFEIQLANISIPEENRRDTMAIYNLYPIAGLYNLTKNFDWLKYFKVIFKNISIDIKDSEQVVCYSPQYMKSLEQLLNVTPKRTLANYLMWNVVMKSIIQLSQRFVDLRKGYQKALHGFDQDQPRWRFCVNYVNDNLGMAVGRLFVEKHFDERSKINALDMIENIRRAFVELLDEVAWMDEETRAVARAKADAIQERIGYPDYIMNNTALDIEYEDVTADPTKYFENFIAGLHVVAKNNLRNLRLPVDRTRWAASPAIVNAFYSANKNQILFPAGILQPPFYHSSYPKSLNFGGIAMVIGHELTHGFDDRGRQYDKDGNLKQWWSDDVITKFKERAQCIIDQYGNYTVKEVGLNLNGKYTQGENIADNGGLKQAFRAYTRWVEKTGIEESSLPGLQLSQKQLFFLNFAQIWCGTARPESHVQSIRTSRHSPGRFRVIGAVSNSKDFAEAYNCPVGSKMNPKKKCAVW